MEKKQNRRTTAVSFRDSCCFCFSPLDGGYAGVRPTFSAPRRISKIAREWYTIPEEKVADRQIFAHVYS